MSVKPSSTRRKQRVQTNIDSYFFPQKKLSPVVISYIDDALARENPVKYLMEQEHIGMGVTPEAFITSETDLNRKTDEIEEIDRQIESQVANQVASQPDCQMDTDQSISMPSLNKIIVQPFDESLSKFTSMPDPTSVAVLFISKHGGYAVNLNREKLDENGKPTLDLEAIPCPVMNLIRYQYTPLGTCSWTPEQMTVIEKFNDFKRLLEGRILSLYDIDPDAIPTIITSALNSIAEQKKASPTMKIDYHTEFGINLNIGEKKFCDRISQSNKVTKIGYGDLLLTKMYQIDTNKYEQKPSGVLIMFGLTFKLPDIFFQEDNITPINELKLLYEGIDKGEFKPNVTHGIYDEFEGTITYREETELTSCPFFMLYLKLTKIGPGHYNATKDGTVFDYLKQPIIISETDGPIYELVEGISLKNFDTYPEIHLMVYDVDSKDIYGYFKYVNTVVNIDLSCSSFEYHNEILEGDYYKEYIDKLPETLEKKYPPVTGGKRKTLKKHKKRTKRCCNNKNKKIRHTRNRRYTRNRRHTRNKQRQTNKK